MALHRQFLKWNSNNSIQHFDMYLEPNAWRTGAETFFSYSPQHQLFGLCAYSNVKKDYTLRYEGIKSLKEAQSILTQEEQEVFGETHQLIIHWRITEPKGFVGLEIDGVTLEIRWEDGKITDLYGQEANLLGVKGVIDFSVEESLTAEERGQLVVVNRLSRIARIAPLNLRLKFLNMRSELLKEA
jgi:hypothetical protein